METQVASAGYSVPTYCPLPDALWHHFLHGNVPGHQIDFMYRPEVPSGQLSQQHFSHLARFVKYIEPRRGCPYAFAIGNLSRDDTQYEPGHGGVALIFGLRIRGAKDHAGRQDPPFCHAAAIVDRHLDEQHILAATTAFHAKLLSQRNGVTEGSAFYHDYLRLGQHPLLLQSRLRRYVGEFDSLPDLPQSQLGLRWTVEGTTPPKRVTIVHPDRTPFEVIAACAARVAAVLVESDIRWTCITSGRESDIAGGTTVRFVPESDAAGENGGEVVLRLDEVPEDLAELAVKLFSARDTRQNAVAHVGWRQAIALPTIDMKEHLNDDIPNSAKSDNIAEMAPVSRRRAKSTRGRLGLLIGGVAAFAVAGLLVAIGLGMQETPQKQEPAPTAAPPELEVQAQSAPIIIDAPALMPSATAKAAAVKAPAAVKEPAKAETPRVTTVANKAAKKKSALEKREDAPKLFTKVQAKE